MKFLILFFSIVGAMSTLNAKQQVIAKSGFDRLTSLPTWEEFKRLNPGQKQDLVKALQGFYVSLAKDPNFKQRADILRNKSELFAMLIGNEFFQRANADTNDGEAEGRQMANSQERAARARTAIQGLESRLGAARQRLAVLEDNDNNAQQNYNEAMTEYRREMQEYETRLRDYNQAIAL
jgi:hypothetical protein